MPNINFIVKNGLTLNGSIVANGSSGSASQVLTSNGSGGVYWNNAVAPSGTTIVRQIFTANSTVNTTFTITDGYSVGAIDVYKNGVKLIIGTEVTATNGTTITLATSAISGTIIDVVGFQSISAYSVNINTASQYSWTNTHIFSNTITVNASTLSVGNTTTNTSITLGTITLSNGVAIATVNSTIYSGTANNANALGGISLATIQSQITGNSATAFANAVSSGGFVSGTTLLFSQTAAPTGWTKVTTHDNKALRVVNGTVGSGGSVAFTTAFGSQAVSGSVSVSGSVGSYTLSTSEIPSHSHGLNSINIFTDLAGGTQNGIRASSAPGDLSVGAGGGGSHNHTWSGSGSFSGSSINLAVQYVDVILATKN
jgi:hypothetical protein